MKFGAWKALPGRLVCQGIALVGRDWGVGLWGEVSTHLMHDERRRTWRHRNRYQTKPFDLFGLSGISDETLRVHLRLYEGYVKPQTNCARTLSRIHPTRTRRSRTNAGLLELTQAGMSSIINCCTDIVGTSSAWRAGAAERLRLSRAVGVHGSYERWKVTFERCGYDARWDGRSVMSIRHGGSCRTIGCLHEHGNVAGFCPSS